MRPKWVGPESGEALFRFTAFFAGQSILHALVPTVRGNGVEPLIEGWIGLLSTVDSTAKSRLT